VGRENDPVGLLEVDDPEQRIDGGHAALEATSVDRGPTCRARRAQPRPGSRCPRLSRRTPWASCSRSDGSTVGPFRPDLPEIVPLPSRLVQPAEGELHALADGDVALGAVGALEVDAPATV